MVNLIINAIEAYPLALRFHDARSVSVEIDDQNRYLSIRIKDRGAGIPSDRLAKLFEPFYTTKGVSGHGLGLGLVIVKRYVKSGFNGTINVTSSRKYGTCFNVKIPL